ncbi:MAG: hypothetical protein ABUL44_03960, partial [Flavobacterium sp.]
MFDKIPSLKDFIIYFIPGALTSFFGLNIFSHYFDKAAHLTTSKISADATLIFIGILFSFIVGFLISQLQIILFSKILKRFVDTPIANTSLSKDLKILLIEKIIRKFSLTTDKDAVLKDKDLIEICLEYIKYKSTEEANSTLNRSKNLSTLSMAINIPVVLAIWNLLIVLDISGFRM